MLERKWILRQANSASGKFGGWPTSPASRHAAIRAQLAGTLVCRANCVSMKLTPLKSVLMYSALALAVSASIPFRSRSGNPLSEPGTEGSGRVSVDSETADRSRAIFLEVAKVITHTALHDHCHPQHVARRRRSRAEHDHMRRMARRDGTLRSQLFRCSWPTKNTTLREALSYKREYPGHPALGFCPAIHGLAEKTSPSAKSAGS